ncbi:hypothetical protein [Wolbachia endosymbiont (group A) of Nomada flava]|uniref:hypothetical protein n=2 Tax=Wolbachia TaxID=953 RepID=UPI000AA72431
MMSSQCSCNVIPVLDTGIQPLLCSHLVKIKSSGSQCLGTGMTKEGSVSYSDDTLLVDNVCIVVRHALE